MQQKRNKNVTKAESLATVYIEQFLGLTEKRKIYKIKTN